VSLRFFLLLFCALALATGCKSPQPAPLPVAAPPSPSEQQLLLQVVDELLGDRPAATLPELERLYPQSMATERARSLTDAFARTQQQVGQLQKDKKLCQQERDRLKKDFRQLQEDQEKLRKLVIEMEKRRR
jgi:hypothetical protein